MCFVVTFVICLFSILTNAHGETGLKAEMISAQKPNEVQILVSLTGMHGLEGYGFAVNFNPSQYEFVTVKRADGSQFKDAPAEMRKAPRASRQKKTAAPQGWRS